MKIVQSAVINVLSVVAVALAGASATWVMARHLSVEQFGRVALVLAIVNAVGILEGLRPVVIFHAHRGEFTWAALYRSARRIAHITGGVVFALALLAGLSVERLGLTLWQTLIVATTMMLFFTLALYWAFLDADGHVAFTGALRGVMWVAVYCAFAWLAFTGASFTAYLLALLAMNVALGAIYYWRLSRDHDLHPPFEGDGRTGWLYRLALENVRLNVSAVTMGVSDRLAIGATLGSSQVALYSAPYEFATKPIAFIRGVAQVLYPSAVRLSKESGSIDAQWLRLTIPIVLLAASGCGLVVCVREELVVLLLGSKYIDSADVFGLLAMTFWVITFGYAANIYLNTHGDFQTQRRFYDWAAALMLVGLAPAVYLGGIEGVAALYLLVRSVDLLLGARVMRTAGARTWWTARGAFVAAAVLAGLVAAWCESLLATFAAFAVSWMLALPQVRRRQ
jgi:O-antigen/teichoic acid export membrane protein